MVANIVALGALTQLTSIVSVKSMEGAVLGRVPKGTEKLNRDALKAGISAAKRGKREWKEVEIPSEITQERLSDCFEG